MFYIASKLLQNIETPSTMIVKKQEKKTEKKPEKKPKKRRAKSMEEILDLPKNYDSRLRTTEKLKRCNVYFLIKNSNEKSF